MGILERGITRYPQRIKDEAKALHASGMSYRAVANHLGISSMTLVRRWVDDEYRIRHNRAVKISRGYEA